MAIETFDVLIVGAGLSGIGQARHLQEKCPGKSFAILEGREAMGGTWDLFRYPGIRSDSDMHTLGYSFKPWTEAKSIADGPSIRRYIHDTAAEGGIEAHIRYGHWVRRAEWSSEDASWTITCERSGSDERVQLKANMLLMCAGYYSYKGGHTPHFEGREDFSGAVIHPQEWPDDLDYSGKRVVVIGSGATAMTLVPAMADGAAHVTMLQRSPTYVVSRPDRDAIANTLRKVLPGQLAYDLTRRKNVALQSFFYKRTRTRPDKIRDLLLGGVRKALGDDQTNAHFTPRYNPWDQRLCLIPNGDLFEAINAGTASVVTDEIERFTETGIRLKSGAHLDADIIVTATGLELVILGDADFVVDGRPVDFSETWSYLGMANSGVPNLIATFGYINASWTLRADLIAEYTCRLINHMDAAGMRQATPQVRPEDEGMAPRDWIDNFSAGYMRRVLDRFPKQGDRLPWINSQDYALERKIFRTLPVDDGVMTFTNPKPAERASARVDRMRELAAE